MLAVGSPHRDESIVVLGLVPSDLGLLSSKGKSWAFWGLGYHGEPAERWVHPPPLCTYPQSGHQLDPTHVPYLGHPSGRQRTEGQARLPIPGLKVEWVWRATEAGAWLPNKAADV